MFQALLLVDVKKMCGKNNIFLFAITLGVSTNQRSWKSPLEWRASGLLTLLGIALFLSVYQDVYPIRVHLVTI